MPSFSNAATVWSISDSAGTMKATRLPLPSAFSDDVRREQSVFPAPVGICSSGRVLPDSSERTP